MDPTFSVVIAVFNGAASIQGCIDSVAAQHPGLAELVVIDGGSRDGTVDVLERNHERIAYWESEPDRGICHAWNKAIDHARGTWILFLGADDELATPETLSRASERLAAVDAAVSIAYGRIELIHADGRPVGHAGEDWSVAKSDFYTSNTIPHQAVFHRRSLFDVMGGFDERFAILGDYELLVRAFKIQDPVFIDVVVSRYQRGGLSEREETMFRRTREAYRARHVNGLAPLPELLAPRVWRAGAFELMRRTVGLRAARRLADAFHRRSEA